MAWINVAPIVLSIIAILFMPGFLVSTIAFPGSSLILRLAQAPAWSVGIVAIWSILGSFLPYRWGLTPFIGFTFVVLLAVWMISQTPIGQTVANMIPANNQPSKHTARRLLATVFVWVIVILPLVLYSNPYDIIQGVDSSYHYNQLWLMEQTGNASPLTSNASMGGLSPRGWYYPNTWHALLSLVTKGPSQAYVVANAFLLAIPLIWLVGIGAWSVATTGRNSMYEWRFVG